MTPDEYKALAVRRKPNKYRARSVKAAGRTYASKAEHRRAIELRLLERGGKIAHLAEQRPYDLIVNGVKICRYVADFYYVERETGLPVNEDVKGFETKDFKIKWALAKALHPEFEWRLVKA